MEDSLGRALARVQLDWQLSDDQMAQLLHLDADAYREALRAARAPDAPTVPAGLGRAPALVSIHQRLSLHFPDPAEQVRWLTTGNSAFDGHKPWDVALSSPENLAWLGYYLASFAEKPVELGPDEA